MSKRDAGIVVGGVGCAAVLMVLQLALYGAIIYGIVRVVKYAWGS